MNNFKMVVFFYIILSSYCINLAMDIDGSNNYSINIADVLPQDYQDYVNGLDTINNANLTSIMQELGRNKYLPKKTLKPLDYLLYLSLVSKSNKEKVPFTQKQQNQFYRASLTQRSVPWVFFINGVAIVVTALFPFINYVGLSQCSSVNQTDCVAQPSVITASSVPSVISSLGVGLLSLYSTGVSTDLSSRKADEIRDKIANLRSSYASLAKYWIDIFFVCPEKARYIANNFDVDALNEAFQRNAYNKKVSKNLIKPLKEAWHYINHGTILPEFTEIEGYIYNKILENKMVELTQQYKVFENRLLLLEKK